MPDGKPTNDKREIIIICLGCGGRDDIVRPFDHEELEALFYCKKCGTLLNNQPDGLQGVIPKLATAVLEAMTGHATTGSRIAAEREAEAKKKADGKSSKKASKKKASKKASKKAKKKASKKKASKKASKKKASKKKATRRRARR